MLSKINKKIWVASFSIYLLSTLTAFGDDITDGADMVNHMIQACRELRSSKNPNQHPLPKIFQSLLNDSIEKAYKEGLPKEYYEQMKSEAKILNDHNRLTLPEWNIMHYRLVEIFERKYRSALKDPEKYAMWGKQEIDPKTLMSQNQTSEFLETHPITPNKETTYFYAENSCPVLMYGDLGVGSLNRAFSENVYPIGVTSSEVIFDGNTSGPRPFMIHDMTHAAQHHSLSKSTLSEDQKLMSKVGSLPKERQRLFQLMHFLERHESFNYGRLCAYEGYPDTQASFSAEHPYLKFRLMNEKDLGWMFPTPAGKERTPELIANWLNQSITLYCKDRSDFLLDRFPALTNDQSCKNSHAETNPLSHAGSDSSEIPSVTKVLEKF